MVTKKTIEAKFRRAGLKSNSTCLWTDIPETLRAEIERSVELQKEEDYILCFYESSKYFLVLTTYRIFTDNDRRSISYPYDLVKDVKLDDIFSGEQLKEENQSINLILTSGKEVTLKVEKGTWHVLYSIIKLLIHKSGSVSD